MIEVLVGIGLGLGIIGLACLVALSWDGVIYTSTTVETHRHVSVGSADDEGASDEGNDA